MTRNDTQQGAKPIDKPLKYDPVLNRKKARGRSLWKRNDTEYAQVKIRGWTGRVPLHNAKTVADAQGARQVLKAEIKAAFRAAAASGGLSKSA